MDHEGDREQGEDHTHGEDLPWPGDAQSPESIAQSRNHRSVAVFSSGPRLCVSTSVHGATIWSRRGATHRHETALEGHTIAARMACISCVPRLAVGGILLCGDRGLVKEGPMNPVAFLIDLVWVAPSVRRMASVKARATSTSPENTRSAPAWYREESQAHKPARARIRMLGFSSRASRMTSALADMPAALRMNSGPLSPALCKVSRWLTSPYIADTPASRRRCTVSRFSSMIIGAIPLSRSRRVTVCPTGRSLPR